MKERICKIIAVSTAVGSVILSMSAVAIYVTSIILKKCTRYLQLSLVFANVADIFMMISVFVMMVVLFIEGFKTILIP